MGKIQSKNLLLFSPEVSRALGFCFLECDVLRLRAYGFQV